MDKSDSHLSVGQSAGWGEVLKYRHCESGHMICEDRSDRSLIIKGYTQYGMDLGGETKCIHVLVKVARTIP